MHIIPNGEITKVTNHSRGVMRARVNVSIAYEEDLNRALGMLDEVCRKVKGKGKISWKGQVCLEYQI